MAIVILLGRRRHVSNENTLASGRVTHLPTEQDLPVSRDRRIASGGKLLGGAVVSGAILALILAVFLSIVITTVTRFLE